MSDKYKFVVHQLVMHILDRLYINTEADIMTPNGEIRGHYKRGEYFFYSNGNELFRNRSAESTYHFLTKQY